MVTCTVREVRRAGGRLISPITHEPQQAVTHDDGDDFGLDGVGFVDPGGRPAAAAPAASLAP
jgi:hypothetical protein